MDNVIGYRGQDDNHPIQNYRFFQGLTNSATFANIEARNSIFHGNITIDNQILNNDNSYIRIMCGDSVSNSPFILLNGNNGYGSATKGLIAFSAQNTESIAPVTLSINPNGSLLFKGNYIGETMDLGGAAIVSKSITYNGYIKYANGLIMQWGNLNMGVSAATVTFTFPVSVNNIIYINAACVNDTYSTLISCKDYTTTRCTLESTAAAGWSRVLIIGYN